MSPFPGGRASPGHFTPGGGAAGPLFVRSVGAFYNSAVDGVTQQNIPQPAGIQTNDDLFVLVNGTASTASPVNAADWTNLFTVSFNRFELFHRKADLTASDEFTIAAHTSLQVAVMAAMSNDIDVTDTITIFQGGFVNAAAGNDWDVDGITVNVTEDPNAAIMLFCGRNSGTVTSGPTVVNASPLATTVAEIAVGQTGEGSVWLHWGFDYENPSLGYGIFEQGYTPDPTGAVQWTQYQRFRLDP